MTPKEKEDLAYCKPALTSSVSEWSNFKDRQLDASGANGASMPDDYGFHTRRELNPWWTVDLIDECLIEEIAIVNRQSYSDRFRKFVVQSSRNGSRWITRYAKRDLSHVSADPASPWRHAFCDPFRARYVRICVPAHEVLHLRRVQIFGRMLDQPGADDPDAEGVDLSSDSRSPTVSGADKAKVLFMQTADNMNYAPLLDITSRTIREYCKRHDCEYESYLGIVRGYYSWHATYNRIPLLRRLLDAGFRGWAFYVDADAFIADLEFDLKSYLSDKKDVALIIAPGGPPPPWWNVNAGVFLLNFGHRVGRTIVRQWSDRFDTITNEQLRDFKDWSTAPEDQWLLAQTLKDLPDAERYTILDKEDPPFLNYQNGRFIRQQLRAYGNFQERLERLRSVVDQVLQQESGPTVPRITA